METLADWIQTRGPLSPTEAVGWAIRLAKHVESLHEHGVAHGNVSPACVLFGSVDPRSPGFMSDVRRTTESLPYHSPERVRGGELSPADDTWAIAATLYTALTGAPPFVGATDAELRQQVLRGAPAPISVYGVDDDRLERLLGLTFATDLGKRLSNAAMLRRELERIHPSPAGLLALEDEEVGDEDQAATAMLSMRDESLREIFAPASVQADSSSSTADTNPPPAAGDATVMRELPAHIMKMAARAAAGSNPPPPPNDASQLPAALQPPAPPQAPEAPRPPAPRPPMPPSQPKPPVAPTPPTPAGGRPAQPAWEPDSSADATRVGPSPAAAIAAIRQSAAGGQAPPAFGASPGRPAPSRPSSPGGSAPRPGFALPNPGAPGPSNAPPPAGDADDVRTVMHSGDVGALLRGAGPETPAAPAARPGAFAQASPPAAKSPGPTGPFAPAKAPTFSQTPAPAPFGQPKPGFAPPGGPAFPPPAAAQQAPPAPAVSAGSASAADADDDEDDGARTVMRESPILTADMLSRAGAPGPMAPKPAAPSPGASRWQHAAPPPQPAPGPAALSGGHPQSPAFQPPGATMGSPGGGMPGPTPNREPSASFQSPHEPSHPGFAAPAMPPGFPDPSKASSGPQAGMSALIQEALAELPGAQAGGSSVESPSQIGFGQNLGGGGSQAAAFGGGYPSQQQQQGFPNQSFGPQGYPVQGYQAPGDSNAQAGQAAVAGPAESEDTKKGGYGSLILVCLLVLVVAAAGTFATLKYQTKLGLTLLGGAPTPIASATATSSVPVSAATSSAPAASASAAPAPLDTASAAPSASATPSSEPKKK